MQSVIYIL